MLHLSILDRAQGGEPSPKTAIHRVRGSRLETWSWILCRGTYTMKVVLIFGTKEETASQVLLDGP